MNRQQRILLVEDDPNLGYLLETFLQTEGFQVALCQDGESAWTQFQQSSFDLCILDIMLPFTDGFSLGKKIRHTALQLPIIFLSAKSRTEDKVRGFRLGADDYLTKPFNEEELLCRIKAILRRSTDHQRTTEKDVINFGESSLHPLKLLLTVQGKTRRITERECEVLRLLIVHKNQIVRREEFLLRIWGKNDYFLGRSLDVFISKLRKYLLPDTRLQIENVFRVGFMLVEKSD